MENSRIPWCHNTMNFWIGCTEVSRACDNCYARIMAAFRGWAKWGNHPRHRTSSTYWKAPLAWNRRAARLGMSYRVFTNSLSDFWDNQVDPAWRVEALDIIRQCHCLDWLILTKRPQNIRKMLPMDWGTGWDNVWLGATVEDMVEAKRRIPLLLKVPAHTRFLSCEPLLEPLDLRPWLGTGIDWVICGGESGHHRRDMAEAWARDLRDQCAEAGCRFFMKQMTATTSTVGERLIPPHLMVREFPAAA